MGYISIVTKGREVRKHFVRKTRTKNVHRYAVRGKKIVIRLEKERERGKERKIEREKQRDIIIMTIMTIRIM